MFFLVVFISPKIGCALRITHILTLIWLVLYVVYLMIQAKLELNLNLYYQKSSYQWVVDIYFEKSSILNIWIMWVNDILLANK